MTRNLTKSLMLAAAVAMWVLAAGSAGASTLSVREAGTHATSIMLGAPGAISVEVVLNADGDGVAVLEFTVSGSAGVPAMIPATTGTVGSLTEFTPPQISAGGVLFTLATFAAGPTNTSGVVGTATFYVSQSGTVFLQPFFYSTNDDVEFANQMGLNELTVTIVPEPGTLLLLGSGLVGLAIVGRRQR